jgi:hypothetical protein
MVQPKTTDKYNILTRCDSLFSSHYGVIISEILSENPFMIAAAITPVDGERSSVQLGPVQLSIKSVAVRTSEWNIVKLMSPHVS